MGEGLTGPETQRPEAQQWADGPGTPRGWTLQGGSFLGVSRVWIASGRMAPGRTPNTAAVRVLRSAGIAFEPFVYAYAAHGGTRQVSERFGIDEHAVIKTLIAEDESRTPMCVLMHGDHDVSLRALARARAAKRIRLCTTGAASRHSGYLIGGISPLGLRTPMDVLVEHTILDLERSYVNGGARGFVVGLATSDLLSVLPHVAVEVGLRR